MEWIGGHEKDDYIFVQCDCTCSGIPFLERCSDSSKNGILEDKWEDRNYRGCSESVRYIMYDSYESGVVGLALTDN